MLVLVVVGADAALWWHLGPPRRTVRSTEPLFDHRPRSASQHRAAAQEHAEAHRWNAAVQERMRAVVRSLEERALIDPRPGSTADEAAAEAGRPLPGHASRLRAAAEDSDAVTYGGRTADGQLYATLRDLDLNLEKAKPLLMAPGTRGAGA